MILDRIKNISRYENLNIDFKAIVKFIDRVTNENLDNGRYDIKGDKLFALVQSYETNDVVFYDDNKDTSKLVVKEGYFALFFTHDAHKPGVKFNTKSNVRKIVFKIFED